MTEDSPTQPEAAGETQAARGPRWWQRVLPVTGIAALALGVAVLALPGLDDEIELSTSREAQPFIELYLTQRPALVCAGGDSPQVRFRMESHLQAVREVGYLISVDPAGQRGASVRDRGTLRLAPGEAKSVWRQVPAPTGTPYDITVRLADRPERLRIHCGGAGR